MIYFIVNNDFHVEHIEYYTKQLPKEEVCIIVIPHTIKYGVKHICDNIVSFETPFGKSDHIRKIFKVKEIKNKIDDKITFGQRDKVVLLSEYEPLNLYVVYKAKTSGAKTYLLQEGIATYYTCIKTDKLPLSFKQWLVLFYMRYILGFKYLQLLNLEKESQYLMDDRYLDEICLYYDISLGRKIDKKIIKSPYSIYSGLDKNTALFLNQPLYETFFSKEIYVKYLSIEINDLASRYEKLIFKFHPRDALDMKDEILSIFAQHQGIFFEDIMDLPGTIQKYKPCNVFSFFSDALMRLKLQGCNVHYLYYKYKELVEHPVIKNTQLFIETRDKYIVNKVSFIKVLGEV